MATVALVRVDGRYDRLARDAGLHPDLVARFVRLGLVDPADPAGAGARLAQAARLRRDDHPHRRRRRTRDQLAPGRARGSGGCGRMINLDCAVSAGPG